VERDGQRDDSLAVVQARLNLAVKQNGELQRQIADLRRQLEGKKNGCDQASADCGGANPGSRPSEPGK